jgi:hypothetical protein
MSNLFWLTEAQMAGLAAEAAVPKTVMIDETYLKAHRTATSLRSKKGGHATREAV